MRRLLIILCLLLSTTVYGAQSNFDLEFGTGTGGTNEDLMDFLADEFLLGGTDITLTYDDNADTLTINSDAVISADDVSVNGTDITDPNFIDSGRISFSTSISDVSADIVNESIDNTKISPSANIEISKLELDVITEVELDTFSELQSQIADETVLKAGTLTDGKICTWDNTNTDIVCTTDSTPVILDLADDGTNESTALAEIAVTNDTGSVWSEPTADKLLFDGTNLIYESELDTEAELEAQLTNVTDVFTNNDGALDDDDISDDLLITGSDGDSTTGSSDSGLEFVGGLLTMIRGCAADEVLKWSETNDNWVCAVDTSGSGGSATILDLGDDGSNESTDITEIAITNDTGSAWSEPVADKLLFDGTSFLYESELDSLSELNTQIADATIASLAGTETLTNKTIDTASNTITVVEADISDLSRTFWSGNWSASSTLATQPQAAAFDGIAPLTKDTGTNIEIITASFDDTADECRGMSFSVPEDVDTTGTAQFYLSWYSQTATTGDAMWFFAHNATNDAESWDATTTSVAATASTVKGTVDQITETTWTETLSNLGWTADETVTAWICRDGDHASDTLTGDAELILVKVEIPRS